jgi:hypothetical protein
VVRCADYYVESDSYDDPLWRNAALLARGEAIYRNDAAASLRTSTPLGREGRNPCSYPMASRMVPAKRSTWAVVAFHALSKDHPESLKR